MGSIKLPPTSAPIHFVKGRGTGSSTGSRFDRWTRETDLDEFDRDTDRLEAAPVRTTVTERIARSIISRNDSPDIPFDRSLNPYAGCEHGCIYCYARPTHAWLGLSPGLDFETRLYAKTNAAALLRVELSRPGYTPALIALGANTDPYQPIEREYGLSRALLEVLSAFNHPVGVTTKSALVARDIDLLAPMAAKGLARVFMSIGTLDPALARVMDPRAPSPQRRMDAVRKLADAGIPVGVLVSPIIPAINDKELEAVLAAAAEAGASTAGYVMLRLPLEVRELFVQWLEQHFPLRAAHVMSLVRQMHDGVDYDPTYGARMRGSGVHADLVEQRFRLAARRLGLDQDRTPLDATQFRVPRDDGGQLGLFDQHAEASN
ncbi:MAG: PA0069 family radical SAM protein [Burkholderiaceae bacterium]